MHRQPYFRRGETEIICWIRDVNRTKLYVLERREKRTKILVFWTQSNAIESILPNFVISKICISMEIRFSYLPRSLDHSTKITTNFHQHFFFFTFVFQESEIVCSSYLVQSSRQQHCAIHSVALLSQTRTLAEQQHQFIMNTWCESNSDAELQQQNSLFFFLFCFSTL